MAKLVSDATANRILHALNRFDLDQGRAGRGGAPRWAFVRCTSATAVGGNSVLDECYPAIILSPAADFPTPPEEGFGALLTLLGDDGNAVTPRLNAVYECLLTGEVESDRSGSGSGLVSGRPRAFGCERDPGDIASGQVTQQAAHTVGAVATWEDTVFTRLTLPEAGTYLLFGNIGFLWEASSTPSTAYVAARVYDVTNGVEVPGSLIVQPAPSEATFLNQMLGHGSFHALYTVTGPTVLRWEGYKSSSGLTVANVGITLPLTSAEVDVLGYIRLTAVPGGAGPKGDKGDPGVTALSDLVALGGVSGGGSV